MLNTLFSLVALFVTTFLMLVGNGLLGSLLGLRLAQQGAGPLAAAVVMTGYYAGLVAGALLCTRIIRRVGHIRAFAAFCATNIATTLLLSIIGGAPVWTLLRFCTGLSMMGAYMVIESWLNERAEASMRGRVFSIYMLVSYGGIGLSQFLLGFSERAGQTLLVIAALLFALCMLPVVLTRAAVPGPMEKVVFDIRHLFRLAPHALYGCLAAGFITGAFYALGPVFAFTRDGNSNLVGVFMGLTILGGLVLQWPLGLLSDRFKRRTILLVLGIALAAASLLLLATSTTRYGEWLMAVVWGGLAFTIYPVAVAYANDRIAPKDLVPAAGALLMAYSAGAALGPLLASVAMRASGARGLYLFTAVVGLLLALLVARRRGAERVPVAEQGSYLPVPRTSTVINQLDPRGEEASESDSEQLDRAKDENQGQIP